VREKHGFFDDQRKKIAHHQYTLNPEEGFTNVADALARYNQQLKYLASQGFVRLSRSEFRGEVRIIVF